GRLPAAAASGRLATLAGDVVNAYRRGMDRFQLHEGAAAVFRLVDGTNAFIADTAPWTLAKDPSNADRLTQVLFQAAEAVRVAAVLLTPIMPTSSAEILRRVGAFSERLSLDGDGIWRADGERVLLEAGPLWPRAEAETATGRHAEAERAGARPRQETVKKVDQ